MAEKLIEFSPESYYHVYNHAVGEEKFFLDKNDCYFFMEKVSKYLEPFYEILSYNLMINHFHFVIRAKSYKEIEDALEMYYKEEFGLYKSSKNKPDVIPFVLSKSFSNLFNCYTKHYNFKYKRKGTLFIRAFRRKHVEDEIYLRDLIIYVHQNPVVAGLCSDPSLWKFSSYKAITLQKSKKINWQFVIELFENLENFIFCNCRSK